MLQKKKKTDQRKLNDIIKLLNVHVTTFTWFNLDIRPSLKIYTGFKT